MMIADSISLRAPEPSDLEMMYVFENNMDAWLYSETSRPFSKFTIEEYLKTAHDDIYSTRQLRLVIDRKSENGKTDAIGFVDLYDFDPRNRRAGVGILIGNVSERNKGHAGSALDHLKKYAFEILNLHQLYCLIEESNLYSMKLFQKAGFKQTAIFRDWIWAKEKWNPVCLLQLIKSEN